MSLKLTFCGRHLDLISQRVAILMGRGKSRDLATVEACHDTGDEVRACHHCTYVIEPDDRRPS